MMSSGQNKFYIVLFMFSKQKSEKMMSSGQNKFYIVLFMFSVKIM